MKENFIRIAMYILLVLTIIVIVCLSIYIVMSKTRNITEYVSLDNIININVSTKVPEEFNKEFDFDLTSDEMIVFIELLKSSGIKRSFGKNEYDGVGYTLTITYSDETTISISYLDKIMLGDNWYQVYGYAFKYVYETDSYKLAYELAKLG